MNDIQDNQEKDSPQVQLNPSDINTMPPLLQSLGTILRLAGRSVSAHYLYANLAGGSHTTTNQDDADADTTTSTAPTSISPQACLRAAKRAGLHGHILEKPTIESISPLTLPCILLLHHQRSCVLLAFDEGPQKEASQNEKSPKDIQGPTATVIFPENGENPITVPLQELEKEYSGYAIFSHLDAPPDARIANITNARIENTSHKKQQTKQGSSWFWSAMGHYAPIYRHAFMASIVINIVAIASPLFTMNVYDRVIPNNAIETLWVLATGIAIIYFFDFFLRTIRTYFVDVAGRNADVVISSMLIHKILTMRLDAKPRSTGALVNNISQFEALRDFFSSSTLLACIDVPFLCIFLILLYFIGGPLVFLPLIAMPILFIAGYLFQWAARRSAEAHYSQGMQKNALLVEIIYGLETLKTSMAENRMQNLWDEVVELSAASTVDSRKYTNRALAFSTLITQCVTVGMIIWGVYRIEEGALTMGGLIACNILAGRAMAPLMQMAALLTRFQNSRLSLNALNTLMALPSENNQALTAIDFSESSSEDSANEFDTSKASFALENVSFTYPEAQSLALHNINLNIKAGEKVAIIGGMGSGKSTLTKLLMGLYEPSEGAVKFNGVDIRQIASSELRSRIGFLPQESILFYGTIRDNIVLGDVHANDRRILRAAELSGVANFVRNNPAGFAAQVGEQGRELSGGQRQAVALARALVRDPEVLILDEPTSNMDTRSEKLVQKNLQSMAGMSNSPSPEQSLAKTIIIVTHRMSMLRMVDRIIVMDNGRIALDGPKDEVLKKLQGSKGEEENNRE